MVMDAEARMEAEAQGGHAANLKHSRVKRRRRQTRSPIPRLLPTRALNDGPRSTLSLTASAS